MRVMNGTSDPTPAGSENRGRRGFRPWLFVAIIFAVLLIAGLAGNYAVPKIVDQVGADVLKLWTRPYFTLGSLDISPAFLLKAAIFLVLLAFLSRSLRRLLRHRVLARTALDEGQKFAISRVTGYLVFLFGLIIGLQSAGLNLESLTVFGGALGIGVGFGLQNVASNFISGLILLVERPIKVGDRIEIGDLNGDVIRIAGRSTWVRTNDNIVIIVPNSEFVSSRVTNWTANDQRIRLGMKVGVAYGSDPEVVRDILLATAKSHPDVLVDPPPAVRFTGFGDSSLDFDLRIWTVTQTKTPQMLKSDLYFAVFRAFRENGIEIPFPQRDVHLRSLPPGVNAQPGADILNAE